MPAYTPGLAHACKLREKVRYVTIFFLSQVDEQFLSEPISDRTDGADIIPVARSLAHLKPSQWTISLVLF